MAVAAVVVTGTLSFAALRVAAGAAAAAVCAVRTTRSALQPDLDMIATKGTLLAGPKLGRGQNKLGRSPRGADRKPFAGGSRARGLRPVCVYSAKPAVSQHQQWCA